MLHEFGHFLHGEPRFSQKVQELYQTESIDTVSFLRDYARKDYCEYFAEYFVYWHENRDNPKTAARMEKLTPQTNQLFTEIADNNGSVPAQMKRRGSREALPPFWILLILL